MQICQHENRDFTIFCLCGIDFSQPHLYTYSRTYRKGYFSWQKKRRPLLSD
nr:MAG TPA: hypothetical protein [Caudoviricetes sp.]